MKTILCTAAVAVLAVAPGTRSADASDLSQMFRALEATGHTTTPAVGKAAQAPASRTPTLLLGAWMTDTEGQLQVSRTVPDSPASQTLAPGDVLCQISVPGGPARSLRTLHQFEYAKRQIGPDRRCVLEVYRPGVGIIPMDVTFADAPGGLADVALSRPLPRVPASAADGEGLVRR